MARISKAEHARILHLADVERRRIADIAADYGCSVANIYALLGKLRRAAPPPMQEAVAGPVVVAAPPPPPVQEVVAGPVAVAAPPPPSSPPAASVVDLFAVPAKPPVDVEPRAAPPAVGPAYARHACSRHACTGHPRTRRAHPGRAHTGRVGPRQARTCEAHTCPHGFTAPAAARATCASAGTREAGLRAGDALGRGRGQPGTRSGRSRICWARSSRSCGPRPQVRSPSGSASSPWISRHWTTTPCNGRSRRASRRGPAPHGGV